MITPTAYKHVIIEKGREEWPNVALSERADNPWSHWLESHLATCTYTCTPLYDQVAIAALKEAEKTE